jgi:monoamine oxidase
MNIVIIGAGLTGANAVEELRNQGYTGDITLQVSERPLALPLLRAGRERAAVQIWAEEVDRSAGSVVAGPTPRVAGDVDGQVGAARGSDLW